MLQRYILWSRSTWKIWRPNSTNWSLGPLSKMNVLYTCYIDGISRDSIEQQWSKLLEHQEVASDRQDKRFVLMCHFTWFHMISHDFTWFQDTSPKPTLWRFAAQGYVEHLGPGFAAGGRGYGSQGTWETWESATQTRRECAKDKTSSIVFAYNFAIQFPQRLSKAKESHGITR